MAARRRRVRFIGAGTPFLGKEHTEIMKQRVLGKRVLMADEQEGCHQRGGVTVPEKRRRLCSKPHTMVTGRFSLKLHTTRTTFQTHPLSLPAPSRALLTFLN